jgi:DNA-binding response OmpR family regulator
MSKALKERVLVIDDEPDLLELIEVNMKAAGFEVLSASNGKEGLEMARKTKPELIVLDVMLPELGGLEVCKSLRRDPATADIPVLMLTARATEIDRVLGLELGADDYVTKPFSTRELVLRVKNLLRRKTAGEISRFAGFRLIGRGIGYPSRADRWI